jgi:hypothetical protein
LSACMAVRQRESRRQKSQNGLLRKGQPFWIASTMAPMIDRSGKRRSMPLDVRSRLFGIPD